MTAKKDYNSEATRLAKAIDVAIEAFKKFPPAGFNQTHVEHMVRVYSEWKENVLNPEPQFRKLVSLQYFTRDVFTFFQESKGKTVDFFWQEIREKNLGYLQEDQLQKILSAGKIKGRLQYEYVTDIITVAEQTGRTTKEESRRLAQMLSDFEQAKNK